MEMDHLVCIYRTIQNIMDPLYLTVQGTYWLAKFMVIERISFSVLMSVNVLNKFLSSWIN